MSLLDIVRAALPGAAAARVGYKHGQDQRAAMDAAAQKERQAQRRQSILDQFKAAKDQADLAHTEAETDKLRNAVPEPPKTRTTSRGTEEWDGTQWRVTVPAKKEPPKTRSTDRGIEEFDEESGTWKLTGRTPYRAPARTPAPRPTPASQSPTERGLTRVERQIDDTRADIVAENNKLSSEPDTARLGRLNRRADSLGRVRDSMTSVVSRGDGAPAVGGSGGGTMPKLNPLKEISQDQFEYLTTPIAKGGKGLSADSVAKLYTVKKP